MNKYKVEFIQKEIFLVDVFAKDEQEAQDKATELFNQGDYQQTGDLQVDIGTIYDVTSTDDPFYPSEDIEMCYCTEGGLATPHQKKYHLA